MVKKKVRWPIYVRGLSLFGALALLFMGVFLGASTPPVYGPALQKKGGEATSDSFRFAVLSDSHKGWGIFMPIMKKIAGDEYHFAVHLGDIVQHSSEDRYGFFFKKLAEIKRKPPIYFVPGNHDISKKDGTYSMENFRRYCGRDQYWFSLGKAAFVVLNDALSTIPEDQFRWLESTLRDIKGTFTHIFVFMHVPPFDPRAGQDYCLPKSDGERFMALMEKYRVDYVFSGHIHCYSRNVINGITYIVIPSAGGTTRCSPPLYGYLHIAVNKEGIKDSVVKVEDDWWFQLKGDIQYELRVRRPYLLVLGVVLGQSSFYFFAA
jgi:3',5'-cyclic AMP phosphodiesterase CpdA